MTKEEYRNAIEDVIYFASCALNSKTPDAERVKAMDLNDVYKASERHLLTGITDMALESAGVKDARFLQARAKAIRKNMIMQADMEALFERLNEAGIWYMPLKGSLMDSLYPSPGTRQMADRDILIDGSRADDVKSIMESLGFTTEHYGTGNHDVYYKQPVSNFEIHRELFGSLFSEKIHDYYSNVKDRLIKDNESGFGYHFSDEDAYIYMIAHEYKHYDGGGTGLRSLLDTYVYCSRLGGTMDWGYIEGEAATLGISDFEKTNRELAMHLFGKAAEQGGVPDDLSSAEREMLDYVIGSGVYGNVNNSVRNRINKFGGGRAGKGRYIFSRVFLPMDVIKEAFPFFYRHKVLLPVLPVFRIGRGLLINRAHLKSELKALKKSK